MKKRLSAVLMAFALIVGCTMNGSLKVAAKESASIDPYIYNVQSVAASPFKIKMNTASITIENRDAVLYKLTDANSVSTIEAYSVDADTELGDAKYRRMNLEDASYFGEADAQRIRAIVKNSVTAAPREQMKNDANQWLKSCGLPEINNLTGAEALSATQYAIWSIANKEIISVAAPYAYYNVNEQAQCYVTGSGNPITYNQEQQYVAVGNDDVKYVSKQNIISYAEYLLSLAPESVKEVAVSDETIKNVTVTYKLAEDETYIAVVEFDLSATVNSETKLTATVSAGENSVTAEITAAGPQTLCLEKLLTKADIKIEINGIQKVNDVFLYEAAGGRTASQSLVGIESGLVPVHAEKMVIPERVINFTKITTIKEEDGSVAEYPLEGIAFDIYYVCSINDFNENYAVYKTPVIGDKQKLGTVITDGLGKATFNVTQAGGPDGVYLIAEHTDHPAIENPLAPFYIAVPATAPDGNGQYATVNLNLKNDIVDGPAIRKDIASIENDKASFDVDEVHTWILRGDIPADLANGKSYVVSDTLDYRLTYKGNMNVKVTAKAAAAYTESAENILSEGTDYTVSYYNVAAENAVDVSGNEAVMTVRMDVSLTKEGMQKVASVIGADHENCELRIYYDAVINTNASAGAEISNRAALQYTSSVNFTYEEESDQPVVYTCAINIDKYDAKDSTKPLAGAVFKIARKATEAEKADVNVETFPLVTGKNNSEEIIYVSFYNNPELSGEKVTSVVTGADGKTMIYGLKALYEADPDNTDGDGDGFKAVPYYLVEIKAPAGYNMLKFPMEVFFNQESHAVEHNVGVANSNAFSLPDTGGIGTTIFTVAGAAIVIVACAALVGKKREERIEL